MTKLNDRGGNFVKLFQQTCWENGCSLRQTVPAVQSE